jgi:hypothetical protein
MRSQGHHCRGSEEVQARGLITPLDGPIATPIPQLYAGGTILGQREQLDGWMG